MITRLDCDPHGWTKDDDGTVWYWKVSDDGELEFTDRGTPTDHPMRQSGEVPEPVRRHAETYLGLDGGS